MKGLCDEEAPPRPKPAEWLKTADRAHSRTVHQDERFGAERSQLKRSLELKQIVKSRRAEAAPRREEGTVRGNAPSRKPALKPLSPQQLIDKGMIWSQRYGETAFTVPMFDAFMKRQMPSLEKHDPRRRRELRKSPPRKK